MKKIAIITCSREPNYGACLQAYATQRVTEELGFESEIMNFPVEDEKLYLPWRNKSVKSMIASFLFFRLRKSLYYAFDEFHRTMKFSKKVYLSCDDFRNDSSNYDIFLVGSDQVWNPYLGINTDISLLRFYEKGPRKISYASSFGVDSLPDGLREKYRDALSKFAYLSTRENDGQRIIHELLGIDVPVVLDPTMLLNKKQWLDISSKKYDGRRFVLLYDMQHTPELIDYACKIAKKRNIKVYALSRVNLRHRNLEVLYGVSPADFISLYYSADCVVTDSFHGTAFSIIFQKEFYSFCGAGGEKLSSRITSLLLNLGLTDRLIIRFDKLKCKNINYQDVENKLNMLRDQSLAYLKTALE